MRYDRAQELREQLQVEIDGLLNQAHNADASGEEDPQKLPGELARRETLKAKWDAACDRLELQAKARAASGQAESREQSGLTDADSHLMRKNKPSEYRQCYNT